MRLVVTGKTGQVVTALIERGIGTHWEVIPIGRPELDLGNVESVRPALIAARPDAIVSAAAYTAVDKAESEKGIAFTINSIAPGAIAQTASELGVPLIQLSTDYVFDGKKPSPYFETDVTGPLGVYGQSKLAGELAIAMATDNYAILRTAWVYSPFGSNFLKTMLRLATDRPVLRVVADQIGTPTSALDIADAILAVVDRMIEVSDTGLRGTFHLVGAGEANWAHFATEIMAASKSLGGPSAGVEPITTADYPTPAPRPANSCLDTSKFAKVFGIVLPVWQQSTAATVRRLLTTP